MACSYDYPTIGHGCLIGATIKNMGILPTGEFKVALYVNRSDGGDVEEKVDSMIIELDPYEKTTIDFPWTPTENGTYDVTIRTDPDNEIEELDEENNNRTRKQEVYKQGYMGGMLDVYESGEINGNMIFSLGDGSYLSSEDYSDIPALTVNFDEAIPDDARIKLARLYLYWGFAHTGDAEDESDPSKSAPLDSEMKFNGAVVPIDKRYTSEGFTSMYGTYCYDVTGLATGGDTATMTRYGPCHHSEYKSYIFGMGILILYEDGSELMRYWISEGGIAQWSRVERGSGLTPEECTVGALFEDEINTTMVNATLYTVLPGGGVNEKRGNGLNRLYFNDERWDGTWQKYEGGSHIALGEKDVTDHLKHEDNLAGIQDRGDVMVAANAFLTLRYAPDMTVSEISKPYAAVVGNAYLINASISNIANGNVGRFNVTFSVNGDLRKAVAIRSLAAGESVNASFLWTPRPRSAYLNGSM